MPYADIEVNRAYSREYRKKNSEAVNTKNRKWAANNRDKIREYQKKSKLKLKLDVFNYYTRGKIKCQCPKCEVYLITMLSIDHINGDRTESNLSGNELYKWIKNNNYPDIFQVLCMNCNFSKGHNNNKCEHLG